jgi:polysaccharide biosynthesis/export protein
MSHCIASAKRSAGSRPLIKQSLQSRHFYRMALPVIGRISSSAAILLTLHMVVLLPMIGCATGHTSQKEDEAVRSLMQFRENLSKGDKADSLSRLGAGDDVKVSVWRQDSLTKSFTVPPNGWVTFPLVGDVEVIGLTPLLLRDRISAELKKYYSDPQVSVDVTAVRSKRVYVMGEVNRPGVINISSSISALEAIAHAGGFTIDAKETAVLLVKSQSSAVSEPLQVVALDLKSALRNGRADENPLIDQGDIVYVPPSAIANVDRFLRRIYPLIQSIVDLETGVVLWPLFEDVISGSYDGRAVIIR